MEIAPTVLLNYDDVLASGLLAPGSIAEFAGLYAGAPAELEAFRADLVPLLRPQDDVEDFRDGRPEVRAAVANAERFLVLAALVSVLLGGVAVAMAARRFVARRLDAVALMKCLGARHREVLRLNVLQLLILVVAAGVIGCSIGFVAQFGLTALLADFIEAKLPPASLQGAVLGPLTALAVAVGCALPPLLQLGGVPPARVLRNDIGPPPLRYSTIYGVAAAAVTALLYVLFGDFELIAYLLAGTVATFFVLYFAGRLLVLALQRFRGGVGVAWRYGIANVARRGRESSVQVVAFGIGLMVLLLLTSVRTELMTEWQATLPASAPNHFLINIQPAEREAIGATLVAAGVAEPQFTPLVRAKISHVNGVPVDDYAARYRARPRRARGRDQPHVVRRAAARQRARLRRVVGRGCRCTADLARRGAARRDRTRARRRDYVRDRRRQPDSAAHEHAPRALGLVPAELFHGPEPRRDRALRAHLHHELVCRARTAPRHRRLGPPVPERLGARHRRRARSSAPVHGPRGVGRAVRVSVHARCRRDGAARRDSGDARRAHVRKRGAAHARRAAQRRAARRRSGVHGARLVGRHARGRGAAAIGYVLATQLFQLDFVPGIALWLGGLVAGALVVGVSGTLAVRSVINHSPVATLRGA